MTLVLARRCLGLILALIATTLVVFAAIEFLPAHFDSPKPAAGLRLDTIAAHRTDASLERPLAERYVAWIEALASGDVATGASASDTADAMIGPRVRLTVMLALSAIVLALAIAIPTGLLAARFRATAAGTAISLASRGSVAMPEFWLAMLLAVLFAVILGWVPVESAAAPGTDGVPEFELLVLPIVALSVPLAAVLTRSARTAALEAHGADYFRAVRAKGLTRNAAFWRHAAANALVPMAAQLGTLVAGLLMATLLVEKVFGLPGIGSLLFDAATRHDDSTVRDLVLILAVMILLARFLAGLGALVLDPRLRRARHAGF